MAREDVVRIISRWPPWIFERNDFSNSESLCHCDAPHQVLAHFNLRFGRRCLWRISWWTSWILERNNVSNSESPFKFWLNPTYGLGGDVVWSISRWPPMISEQNDFSNSETLKLSKASHQVSAQSDLFFGIRCRLKNFKMAAVAAILDIGTERF